MSMYILSPHLFDSTRFDLALTYCAIAIVLHVN